VHGPCCIATEVFLPMMPMVSAFVLLGRFVRPRPITLGIPPKSGEGGREFRWRFGRRQ
jgi:hypothetical protein